MSFVCGFDEAGRGCLAGPVSAACVILNANFPKDILIQLDDSKKLSQKKRNFLFTYIKRYSYWGHAFVSHTVIDKMNILQASLLAMRLSFIDLCTKGYKDFDESKVKDTVQGIVDGTFCPNVIFPCICVPKADAKYPCVMAASIVAKVKRDALMAQYHLLYPQYEYDRNKGYPTKKHKQICKQIGPSPIQRLSFSY